MEKSFSRVSGKGEKCGRTSQNERHMNRPAHSEPRVRSSAQDEMYDLWTTPQPRHPADRSSAQNDRYARRTTQQWRQPAGTSSARDESYAPRTTQQWPRSAGVSSVQDKKRVTRMNQQPRHFASLSRLSIGQPSASDKQTALKDTEVQILLIGKTGNGKSSTGNTILGRSKPVFEVSAGILSATVHTQLAESDRVYGAGKIKVQVVDFPDVSCDMDQQSVEVEVRRCSDLTYPFPSATCLVVRSDVRFTPEEYAAYRKTKELLGRRASGNLIVVFTMGDKLPTDDENSFSEQLRQANKKLRQVLQDADNRYVVFSNNPTEHDGLDNRATGRGREDQVTQLLDMVVDIQNDRASAMKRLKTILLGPTGSGKSSTGNSLLYTNPQFRVNIGFSAVTQSFDQAMGIVRGHTLEVLDTPGIVSSGGYVHGGDVHQWFANLNPGTNVLLFVINARDRFKEGDFQLFETLKHIIGKDVNKHLIVVFTGGDELENWHTTIVDQLRGAPPCLQRLLEEAENRYVVFDNKTDDIEKKLLQRNRLLEEMLKVAEMNKGTALKVSGKPLPRQPSKTAFLDEITLHQTPEHGERTPQTTGRPRADKKRDAPGSTNEVPWVEKCTIS